MLFLYCEVGEMVTTEFRRLNTEIHQCDWHRYPLQLKRMLVVFMTNAQMPTIIRGFANTACTREMLMQVMKMTYQNSISA